ncbi:MAG: glycosyltransferase [Deltaproteobacteria bacterium]|nr:MAG: glycosyltransferase [Deltaproteobacteria bacterium]
MRTARKCYPFGYPRGKIELSESEKTKLGYILKGYPRISETFISNEIHLLEELGFSLHLFSMRNPRESFTHQSVKRIAAQVSYLPETLLRHLPRLLYYNAMLVKARPEAYGQALRLMFSRFRRTRKVATIKHLLQAGYLVQALLPGTAVRHLHAHFAHSPSSVALFASYLTGLPFSFTAHAKDIYISDARQLREKIGKAKFVVTCNGYNRSFLKGLTPDGPPIHCIYHGIDTELFSGPSQYHEPSPPYRILSIARLVEKKGLPTVFHAIRHLLDQGFSLRYTLIGDGEDRRPLLDLIDRLSLSEMCDWLGTQPHEEVLQHYKTADLFVLGCEIAKNGDRDGIPNVLLESMAMGVPVLATRVSAIPELVEDGRCGVLVPPGQPVAMAKAMARLLVDNHLRRRIIPAARRRVRRNFDNRELILRLADLFESVGINRVSMLPRTTPERAQR